jgi:hypothetical protein
MTTEQEEQNKPVQQPTPIDPRVTQLWSELSEEASTNYNEGFKKIIRSDEYEYNGETYHFRMLNHKDTGALKKLEREKVDENEDWDGYVNNYRQRAKLLIKDMTDEKFDSGDFFILENLITAWSIRATKGFRHLLKVS